MLFLKLSATLCQRSSYLFICFTLKCKPLIPIVWTYTGFSWVLRHRNHERKRKFYLFRGFTPHQISRQPIYLQAILSVKIHSAVQVTDLRPTFSPWNLVVPSCCCSFSSDPTHHVITNAKSLFLPPMTDVHINI
jgi:hypothetical protein